MKVSPEIEGRISEFVATGRYADANDVVSSALDALREEDAIEARLGPLLLEGLEGDPVEVTPEEFEKLRERVRRQANDRANV